MTELTQAELSFLASVFEDSYEHYAEALEDWFAKDVSKDREEWQRFLEKCDKLRERP